MLPFLGFYEPLFEHYSAANLDVHGCNFEYSGIPEGIGHLTDLTELDLSYTLMFGPLDGTIFANLTRLAALELGGNSYYSPIPDEIASLPNLQRLYAENTHLTGNISFIADMSVIFELWIDQNEDLTGTIPVGIGRVQTLESLSVTDCDLTGTIPSEVGLLSDMQQLWLYNNSLTGTIPNQLGALTRLYVFQTEGNALSGAMPSSVCAVRAETESTFLGTDCLGPQPEVFCSCCDCCEAPCYGDFRVSAADHLDGMGIDLQGRYQRQALAWLESDEGLQSYSSYQIQQRFALATLYFATYSVASVFTNAEFGEGERIPGWTDSTGWVGAGTECDWFGVTCIDGIVTELDLDSNGMTGSFPPEFTLLKDSLTKLNIGGNIIEANGNLGGLDWIGAMTALTSLDIYYNNFVYDGIPPGLAALTDLEDLDISYTLFFGMLDGSIFTNLTALEHIEMGGNSYNTAAPTEIAALPNLQRFYAELSHLTGDLSFIGDMGVISQLWIDDNPGINGTIPASIGNATTLSSLSLTHCALSGTIPTDLANLEDLSELWLYGNDLTGLLPTDLGTLNSLSTFRVELNNLTGSVPDLYCGTNTTWDRLTVDCTVTCDCCTCCAQSGADSPC